MGESARKGDLKIINKHVQDHQQIQMLVEIDEVKMDKIIGDIIIFAKSLKNKKKKRLEEDQDE